MLQFVCSSQATQNPRQIGVSRHLKCIYHKINFCQFIDTWLKIYEEEEEEAEKEDEADEEEGRRNEKPLKTGCLLNQRICLNSVISTRTAHFKSIC